jgi:cell division protein FtsB
MACACVGMPAVSHAMSAATAKARIEELETDLRQRNEKIAELKREKEEAVELVSKMREHPLGW